MAAASNRTTNGHRRRRRGLLRLHSGRQRTCSRQLMSVLKAELEVRPTVARPAPDEFKFNYILLNGLSHRNVSLSRVEDFHLCTPPRVWQRKNLSNYAVMSIFSQLVLFFRRFSVGEGGPIELIPKSTSMLIRCDNWAQMEKEILVEIQSCLVWLHRQGPCRIKQQVLQKNYSTVVSRYTPLVILLWTINLWFSLFRGLFRNLAFNFRLFL